MSYFERIQACNHWNPEGFRPLYCEGSVAGWLRPGFIDVLARWPEVFEIRETEGRLHPSLDDFESRNGAVAGVLEGLREQGILKYLMGEQYPATPTTREAALFLLDRAAAAYFGIRAFGQHINGYVNTPDGLKMWIGRRSSDRRNFPDRLDNLAAGGLPHDLGLTENLIKECHEEAGIPAEMASKAVPVGTVTYCREIEKGLKPDVLYCYDLALPGDFQPRCTDGEMSDYSLLPIEEVLEVVRDTDEFKPNCSLVIIDFAIRHGYIQPDEPDYCRLVEGLHVGLP